METLGYLFGFFLIVGAALWGSLYEIKRIRAAIAKEQKQMQLYEALLQKLEEC